MGLTKFQIVGISLGIVGSTGTAIFLSYKFRKWIMRQVVKRRQRRELQVESDQEAIELQVIARPSPEYSLSLDSEGQRASRRRARGFDAVQTHVYHNFIPTSLGPISTYDQGTSPSAPKAHRTQSSMRAGGTEGRPNGGQ